MIYLVLRYIKHNFVKTYNIYLFG